MSSPEPSLSTLSGQPGPSSPGPEGQLWPQPTGASQQGPRPGVIQLKWWVLLA